MLNSQELEPHQMAALIFEESAAGREKILEFLFSNQVYDKNKPWDGCYGVAKKILTPWMDSFDPNSRVLVSVLLAKAYLDGLIPLHYLFETRRAIEHALEVELSERRINTAYTNIAISYAVLLYLAAEIFKKISYKDISDEIFHQILSTYKEMAAFFEFNSTTYLGLSYLIISFLNNENYPIVQELKFELENSLNHLYGSDDVFIPLATIRGYDLYPNYGVQIGAMLTGQKGLEDANRHKGDLSFMNLAKNYSFIPHSVNIPRIGNQFFDYEVIKQDNFIYSAINFKAADIWHHQTFNLVLASDKGGLALRTPYYNFQLCSDKILVKEHLLRQTGLPSWLWGGYKDEKLFSYNNEYENKVELVLDGKYIIDENSITLNTKSFIFPNVIEKIKGKLFVIIKDGEEILIV